MTDEELVCHCFEIWDRLLRPASVGKLGVSQSVLQPVCSLVTGHFVGLPGESWPVLDGKPMFPLLQLRTDELQYRPPALQDVALLTIFRHHKKLPVKLPAKNGDHWLLRAYSELEGLALLPDPPDDLTRRGFPITWSLLEKDGPQWEDGGDSIDNDLLKKYCELPDPWGLYHDRYKCYYGTKVGGWPCWAQGSYPRQLGSFALQLGSHWEAGWRWGSDGCGFIFRDEGKVWSLVWDCN